MQREESVTFYSTWFCPYAQRAWIALEVKKIPYQWVEAVLYKDNDLSTKISLTIEEKKQLNPEFIESSPRGLVPALSISNPLKLTATKVYESLPILEFIEESYLSPTFRSLLPLDPAERAHIRIGISLWQELVIRRFYTLLMSPRPDWEKNTDALLNGYLEIIGYFTGSIFYSPHGFSLFECACLPWYQRTLSVLKVYRGFVLPDGNKFDRLKLWYSECLNEPAFANTIVSEEKIIENYSGYADNTATSNEAKLTTAQITK